MTFTERERSESHLQRATRLGDEARYEGVSFLLCPYPRNTILWHGWRSGWIAANAALQKEPMTNEA